MDSIPPQIPSPNDDDNDALMAQKPLNTNTAQQPQASALTKQHITHHTNRASSLPLNGSISFMNDQQITQNTINRMMLNEHQIQSNCKSAGNKKKKKKKRNKKRCAALDYLSDSPKKKRGRKVKDKKNMPPIQKQPFFLVFPDLRLKCPQCEHIAMCQGTLVQHLRTHPTSRKCPECSKIFSTQQNLIKHARLHTGERPYPCPIAACKWAYKQKGDLLAHIQRGKHGTSSDNNRKPPPYKFYHGSTKLPTLHAISKEDVCAAPDLKQLIIALRKREEMKKKQKEKVKQKRKNQLDDFVLSMFLSIYDIDNHEMKNLLKIAKTKYKEKLRKKQIHHCCNNTNNREMTDDDHNDDKHEDGHNDKQEEHAIDIVFGDNEEAKACAEYLKIESLPAGKKVNIKFKYLVNRVYGDYSIVLVPVNSVPVEEIYDTTPEIVIDPKLIPALNVLRQKKKAAIDDVLNEINTNEWTPNDSIPPPLKKQRLNNGNGHNMKELNDNHIVLSKGVRVLGRVGHIPRKRSYHKYNQTAEGFWQCDAPNCGSLFLTKELLESHCKELHDSGYYGCKYCERIYRSQKNVQNHLKKAHGKHGDEYLNALIYNKFHQIIRIQQSKWRLITKNKEEEEDKEALVTKSIVFKTHPINNTILRQEHDSEKEDDDDDAVHIETHTKHNLVPWVMQDKTKKSGRGRGRPRRVLRMEHLDEYMDGEKEIKSRTKGGKRGRPRGRPKGSKNKPKEAGAIKKRPRGRPKGSKNKKKSAIKKRNNKREMSVSEGGDEESQESEMSESRDDESYEDSALYIHSDENINGDCEDENDSYEIGTIYDDIDGGDESSVCRDEQSILVQDLKLEKRKKDKTKSKRKRGRKRKRNEMSLINEREANEMKRIKTEPIMNLGAISMKPEEHNNNQHILRLPTFDVAPNLPNIADIAGLLPVATASNNDISLPSISNLFGASQTSQASMSDLSNLNNLDIPMPAMPSLNSTAAELNGLLSQIDGNNGNVDYNSIIESLFSSDTASNTQNQNQNNNNNTLLRSPINSRVNQNTINQLNQINTLNQLNNQLNQNSSAFNIAAMSNLLNNTNANAPHSSTHSSEEPISIHPISSQQNRHHHLRNLFQSGTMLNNYGNIVNNNYLLKKMNPSQEKDKSESPFVPPLVEAVCGATGCIKIKRDDGKPLLMCGRCFNIKYCSKRCQLAHIHEHRIVCKKKGATQQ